MKLLLVLALLAAGLYAYLAWLRPAPSTWCTAEPVRACATVNPTTTLRRPR